MGTRLALTLYAEWSQHLTPGDMNAAVRMALTARDDGAPPLYYGGWEALAAALGYWKPGADPESVRRQTQRVITKLVRKGVITSSGQARPRVRAEYALNLDPLYQFEPVGEGRAVTWRRVPRADPRAVDNRPSPSGGGLAESGTGDSQSPARGDSGSPPKETLQETHQDWPGQACPLTASGASAELARPGGGPTWPVWSTSCPRSHSWGWGMDRERLALVPGWGPRAYRCGPPGSQGLRVADQCRAARRSFAATTWRSSA